METDVKNDNPIVILMPLENLERPVFRNDPFYGSVKRNNLLYVDNSSLDANEEKDNLKANVMLKFYHHMFRNFQSCATPIHIFHVTP